MNAERCFRQLECFPAILSALVSDLTSDELRWRPAESDWSIVEILCHLLDEEVEDFRTRLRMTLEHPGESWPTIDPVQAAVVRQYRQQNATEILCRFIAERQGSLLWLRQLRTPDWSIQYHHPKLGVIHSGDLLSAWVAHDLLHLKQTTRRLYQRTVADAKPFGTEYAGDWRA